MPHLIALPGTLLDSLSLAALLHGLGARTEVRRTARHIDDETDRLVEVAAQNGGGRGRGPGLGPGLGPFVWLGHSLGGIVALHLALRHPQHVAGLVLLGANGRAGRDSSQTRRAAQWALAQQDGLHALAHSKLAPGYGLAEDDAALDTLVAQAQAVGLPRFANQLAYAAQRPGLLAPRQTLNIPVLALSAEHDTLCPPAHSDEIVALVAPLHLAQHHCLAGAGHLFPMQHAAWAAAHLHTFLTHLKAPRP